MPLFLITCLDNYWFIAFSDCQKHEIMNKIKNNITNTSLADY